MASDVKSDRYDGPTPHGWWEIDLGTFGALSVHECLPIISFNRLLASIT